MKAASRCRLGLRLGFGDVGSMSGLPKSGHGLDDCECGTSRDGASLNGAERACLERAADPLDGAGNPKLFGNDADRGCRRERPGRCAEQRDELAAFHSITSSAAA